MWVSRIDPATDDTVTVSVDLQCIAMFFRIKNKEIKNSGTSIEVDQNLKVKIPSQNFPACLQHLKQSFKFLIFPLQPHPSPFMRPVAHYLPVPINNYCGLTSSQPFFQPVQSFCQLLPNSGLPTD